MALNTRQKRGSVMLMSMPFRPWLAHPDGTLDAGDRMSMMKLGSGIPPGAPAEPTGGGAGLIRRMRRYITAIYG